jgi:threonine dehydrogenase-like Zn-dependent dehydrogenase
MARRITDWRKSPCRRLGRARCWSRVLATGVCASDVKTWHGARVWGSDEIAPYIEAPVTAGHEFVGEVVALGEGAAEKHGLAVGDWAVSEQIVPCWQCRFLPAGPVLDVPAARYLWL